MEPEPMEPSSSVASGSVHHRGGAESDGGSDLRRATALVSRWTLDFAFRSLCRHFEAGERDDLDLTLKKLEANCVGCVLSGEQAQKRNIAAFLGRVMHGTQIPDGVEGEEGEAEAMPLMEATGLWHSLRDTVADGEEHDAITTLLHVQSVAVCLAEGRRAAASTALKWLKETQNIPKNLAIKLSTLVAKGDSNHPYMRNFPYRDLLEKVQVFLDSFLADHPSDFLLKAALKVSQSSHCPDSSGQLDQCSSHAPETPTPALKRPRKRLFNPSKQACWLPPSGKKPQRNSGRVTGARSHATAATAAAAAAPTRKGRRKWTPLMDDLLRKAVQKHGEGRWRQMLLDHTFSGRTGVMLKDRWRILKRDATA